MEGKRCYMYHPANAEEAARLDKTIAYLQDVGDESGAVIFKMQSGAVPCLCGFNGYKGDA